MGFHSDLISCVREDKFTDPNEFIEKGHTCEFIYRMKIECDLKSRKSYKSNESVVSSTDQGYKRSSWNTGSNENENYLKEL